MTTKNRQADYSVINGISLDIFTETELRKIHNATLETLTEMGINITNQEALDIFENAGAKVDRSNRRVKIPADIIEEAIQSAPSELLLAGRNPEHDLVLGKSRVNFTTFGPCNKIIDYQTGEYRDTAKEDVADTARLVDYLDQVDIYSHAVSAIDSPEENTDLHEAEAFLNNTSKHCMHLNLTSGENAKKYFEMGAAVAGGMDKLRDRPLISALVCPQSPYEIHGEAAQIIIESARAGIPINVLSMAMAGATSPITLAGTLVEHNAEVLTGITLAQLVNKGAPVIYGSSTTIFDVAESTAPVGSPELGICNAGIARLAGYYNLPSYTAAGQSDSKKSDIQAGHEKTMTMMLPAMAGSNILYGLGMLELGVAFSHSQLVLDAEMARMVRRVIQGVDVNDYTMAVEDIKEVGPGGDFLTQQHTIDNMHSEQARADIFDRQMRSNWEASGSKTAKENAEERVKEIMESHEPEPLAEEIQAELKEIVESAKN